MLSRPGTVTVIGWIWICAGAALFMGVAMAGFSFLIGSHVDVPSNANLPPELGLINVLLGNVAVLMTIQFAIAAAAIWAGIEFLRLKRWARAVLEILSWATLMWATGFGIYWVYAWVLISGQSAPTASQGAPDAFQLTGAVFGMLTTVVFSIALVVMIWSLRSDQVRRAVAGAVI